jgi:hypothetical protein
MSKSLPKSELSTFILCEDIRQETGNKLSFMGVFANNDILVEKDTRPIVIPSLMFALLARGGNGSCQSRVLLIAPNGETVVETAPETATLDIEKAHFLATKLLGPPLMPGEYIIKFLFDDVAIQRSFKVKVGAT